MVPPLSGENTAGALEATIFKRNKGFDSFPCVLNIIPICFKISITTSLFTSLHKGEE